MKELEQQTSIAEKQYQKFDNVFESNKKEEYKTGKQKRTSSIQIQSMIITLLSTNITTLKNLLNFLLIQN